MSGGSGGRTSLTCSLLEKRCRPGCRWELPFDAIDEGVFGAGCGGGSSALSAALPPEIDGSMEFGVGSVDAEQELLGAG